MNLSEILQDSGELGTMQLEIFDLDIKSLKTYEKDLVKVYKNGTKKEESLQDNNRSDTKDS